MKFFSFIFGVLLLLFGISACEDRMDCVCTQEFRWVAVHIQKRDGTPVDSLKTWTRDKLTSQILKADTTSALISHPTGEYMMLSDAERRFLTHSVKTVLFSAQNSLWSIEREYGFYVDDCGCHIMKSTGVDTIIVN